MDDEREDDGMGSQCGGSSRSGGEGGWREAHGFKKTVKEITSQRLVVDLIEGE